MAPDQPTDTVGRAMAEPLFSPANALAVYGTLAPGEVNHHAVIDVGGRWIDGVIRGYVFEVTWGGAEGFPGFYPDPEGNRVPVKVLVADDIDRHWERLDRFEGPGFRRVVTDVFAGDGDGYGDRASIGQAFVYECLTDND